MVHNLKIATQYIDRVIDGTKKFEIRKNDRSFKVGDTVVLNEVLGVRSVRCKITYITDYEQKDNYVVFGIKVTKKTI